MSKLSPGLRLSCLIVAGSMFMPLLDGVIINTSLPQMAQSFGVRPIEMSLGVTIYLLSTATFLATSGYLADRFGARRVCVAAILLFTIASVGCGLAQNLFQFAVARVLQGVGAALIMTVGRAIVLSQAQKPEIVHVVGIIIWPALFAPVIGPVLGGFITTYASWRWNFLLNVPIGLVTAALVLRYLPKPAPRAVKEFDLKGFALSTLALVCLLYGLQRLSDDASTWRLDLLLLAAGTVAAIASVRYLHRAAHPLLSLAPLAVQTFRIANATSGLVIWSVIMATPFLLPLLLQIGFGASAAQAGTLLSVYFLGNFAMKMVTTPILKRFGFRGLLTVNGLLVGISIGLCALLSSAALTPWAIAVLVLAGATRSMQFTGQNTLQFADIPPAQRGTATALSGVLQQLGMALGVGVGAVTLQLSATLRGAASLGLWDFRFALLLLAVIGVCAALGNLALPAHAGAEVSGHRKD